MLFSYENTFLPKRFIFLAHQGAIWLTKTQKYASSRMKVLLHRKFLFFLLITAQSDWLKHKSMILSYENTSLPEIFIFPAHHGAIWLAKWPKYAFLKILFYTKFSFSLLIVVQSDWHKLQFYHTHLYQKGEQYVNVKSMFSSVVVLLLIVR